MPRSLAARLLSLALLALLTLPLGGCVTAWERPLTGAYPARTGLNGEDYLIGWRQRF